MDTDKERRKRLASLPFSEKLKILEKLRERSRVIAASGLRKTKARQAVDQPGEKQGSAE
jgi:hypothetical protein